MPLPAVASPASDLRITLGRVGIVVTLLAWVAYITVTVISQFVNRGFQGMRFTSESIAYVVIMTLLTFSSLMYLVARQGALYRTRAHQRVPRALLDDAFDTSLPTMTVLVPSYREEVGDGPQDVAVGGAAGVPVPARRAAARRSADAEPSANTRVRWPRPGHWPPN